MDHNLEDSLNLEGGIENMDFDHAGVVINQGDITLESNEIQFEEQEMLMDTGNEEIIVTDFMGDQFTLQEYSVQDKQTSEPGSMVKLNQMAVISQADAVLDLPKDNDTVTQTVAQGLSGQQKFLAVKAALAKPVKKSEAASIPKQVAIAPKPPKPPKQPHILEKATFASGKQYSIAPKPVALVVNKNFKKVSLTGIQGNIKGNAVWAPLGKKVLMVPADAAQKIKFVQSSKSVTSTQITKPVMAKVIVQGSTSGIDVVNDQAVVSTKIIPAISSASSAQYLMPAKTVPVSFARNKVLLGSPTKEGLRFSKKQIIAIKSPTSKLVPAAAQGTTTKRVVITTNPQQNIILKSALPSKLAHISKDNNSLVVQGQQHTQLHQVNVPGKGIQFIRLVSNPSNSQAAAKVPPPKPGSWGPMTSHSINVPSKNFVLTDSKGNIIQMGSEKMASGQPPPLVITASTANTTTTERKFVRIAPVTSKSGQAETQTVRSTQSLLAPLASITNTRVTIDDVKDTKKIRVIKPVERLDEEQEIHPEVGVEDQVVKLEQDSKMALRQLISNTVGVEQKVEEEADVHEETAYDQNQVHLDDDSVNAEKVEVNKDEEHPLIVIPSNFRQPAYTVARRDPSFSEEDSNMSLPDEQKSFSTTVNIETEITSYDPSKTPEPVSDSDVVTTDLGLRPRKACNCTKSQCLKLYCDCFANGEFCNSCNCNNCHNNLENEELRQRAIRSCLDRNPYAFKPKIGKSKAGGPEIIRRHNKGCNCKRSGCLKNYCECYEAKIACTSMCRCFGCRNVEETLVRRRDLRLKEKLNDSAFRPPAIGQVKQPCSFMTTEVIEAVCQCLIAAAAESEDNATESRDDEAPDASHSPVRDVIEEFAKCLQEIIGASHQALPHSEEEQAC